MFDVLVCFYALVATVMVVNLVIWDTCVDIYKSITTQLKLANSFYQGCNYLAFTAFAVFAIVQEWHNGGDFYLCSASDVTSSKGIKNHFWTSVYMSLQIGWYCANWIILFLQIKRDKDFWQMLIHHSLTPLVIYLACRIGLGVIIIWLLLLHDVSDVFLHFAKVCKYYHYSRMCNLLFVISDENCNKNVDTSTKQ